MVFLEEMKECEKEYIEKLYELSFPPAERKPFSMIMNMWKENKAIPYVIHESEGGEPIGLCFFVLHKHFALWDYLAIDPSKQDKGYGTEVIKAVKEKLTGKLVFGEVEEPDEAAENNKDRIRRMSFYLRNGVHATDLVVDLFQCIFRVMYVGDTPITYEEYYEVYGSFVKENVLKKNLRIVRREKLDEGLYINK